MSWDNLLQDVRYGARMLHKNPGFTIAAVLTVALGIGATTSILGILYGVLLKPLPYDRPDRLVRVGEDPAWMSPSSGVFLDWKENSRSFENLSIVQGAEMNLAGDGIPERLSGQSVSANFLDILHVHPLLGRAFRAEEDQTGSDSKVMILTYGLWQRRFGGAREMLGRRINLNSQAYTVIGVLPPEALFSPGVQFLVPLVLDPKEWRHNRVTQLFSVFGRLKTGLTKAQAETELAMIKERLRADYPKNKFAWHTTVIPLQEELAGPFKAMLGMLLGGALCVLLIGCSNVSNLLLARAVARQKEMAVRAALGATRWRVFRQVLTENVLLGAMGGCLGAFFAFWGVRALSLVISRPGSGFDPFPWRIGLGTPMLVASLLLSLGTGFLFGLVPAVTISARNLKTFLSEGNRLSPGTKRQRIRQGLVVAQVALALMLLVVMALFLQSVMGLLHAPAGFKPESTLVMDISLPSANYPDATRRATFFGLLFERLNGLPGVEAVSSATTVPLEGSFVGPVTVVGRKNQPDPGYLAGFDRVRGQYFRAMGIRVLHGRDFSERDAFTNAPSVCLFNQELVADVFPGEDPLGKWVSFWGNDWEIVGVVANTRNNGLDQEAHNGRIYFPHFQLAVERTESLIVRAHGDPSALADAIRKAVLQIDPDQPVAYTRTLRQVVDRSIADRRLTGQVLSLFAALALGLAVIGLYAVLAYDVTQRMNEIGIRMALGAQRADILRLVLKNGSRLTLVGVGTGLLGGLAATRVIQNQLYHVSAADPLTFAVVALSVIGVALLASWLPAHRATKVDPMTALRYE